MNTAKENINKLPDECYIVVEGNARGVRIGLVKAGESGYYQMREPGVLFDLDIDAVEAFVNLMNAGDGVTVAQRKAMEYGSMFGWQVPAADPDNPMHTGGVDIPAEQE